MLERRLTNFTVARKVLRNNYRSRNLIGHYPFWVISPRNSTLFTRPFLTGRCVWAGHETRPDSSFLVWSGHARLGGGGGTNEGACVAKLRESGL